MSELWSQYGNYILTGAFVFLMLRMHRRGGGCCGGGHQGEEESNNEDSRAEKENGSCH